ncbi:hypothetical protein CTheo_8259 [Ceratobasidium theobromae]|uniref:DNA 3'-5' helicase n=1 Tax=Ceratobasidium theobromae TaxID=1582974 RepID=A0A5N5Q933_9AGAM|nr:hypothetical protein CTheo_8259 [Ceratobasidium theobromae]
MASLPPEPNTLPNTDSLSEPLSHGFTFEPVHGLPSVVTCPELRDELLGFVPSHNLLCCIACTAPTTLLYPKTAPQHMKEKHMKPIRGLELKIKTLAAKVNAWMEPLDHYPKPQTLVAPLEFLPVVQMWKCLLCQEQKNSWFGSSETSRINHFTLAHPQEPARDGQEKVVTAQSFCPYAGGKTWFEVCSELAPLIPQQEEDLYETDGVATEELVTAFITKYRPVRLEKPTQVSLKDTHPFLYATGWSKHIQDRDPFDLCSLVSVPHPENEEPLRRIYDAACREFEEEQSLVESKKYPPVWMTNLMDDGSGYPTRPFRSLQGDTMKQYASSWGRWVAFVLRLYHREEKGDLRYKVTMTLEQRRCVRRAIAYCDNDPNRPRAKRILADMAYWFWRPNNDRHFEHLAADQFDDPTVRFAALINLREDGSFEMPSNATHNMVQIKFFIRLALLMWSRLEHEEGRASVSGTIERIACGVSRRVLSPFACICVAVSCGTTYAATTIHLPNVMWCSDDTLNLEGNMIDWLKFREAFNSSINELEKHIQETLLMGIPLDDFGFTLTEESRLTDDFSRTDQGYSFLSDQNNPFTTMETKLGTTFLHDPRAAHLHHGLNQDGDIAWDEQNISHWLGECKWAAERLAFLMHIAGGQPGRGVEFCLIKIRNPLYRLRGIYWLGPGRIVFVLYYNKTTSNTGRDWIVAHAVPWCIGRWFLVLHTLINPLVGQLLLRLGVGPSGQFVQLSSAFAANGKELTSDRLGSVIQAWFRDRLGVPIRIRLLRQLIIALQRKLMPEAYSPIRKVIQILDAQAGHTTETAVRNYAIDASETHLLAPDSVFKEVAASTRWWLVIIDRSRLTLAEIKDGETAPVTIAQEENGSSPAFFGAIPNAKAIAEATVAAWRESGLVKELAKDIAQQITHQPTTSTSISSIPPTPLESSISGFSVAPRVLVQPDHLDIVRRFKKSPNAQFLSDGQGQALVHVLSRSSSLICVLPTGKGKSLLFSALPLVERGITVVVFPLRALLQDQIRSSRDRKHLRPFQEWAYGERFDHGIVVVSVEDVIKPAFATWLAGMNVSQMLNRIVIDEAHMVVTESNYRAAMGNLKGLIQHGVPIVCLTATLPPSMQPQLRHSLGSPTFYSELRPGEGIMVQCRSTDDVRYIAQELGAPAYYSTLDPLEKDEIAADWLSGEKPTVVCTTALGTGVNHPSCRAVLHFGVPWGMVDYSQEVGRSGRDGLPALGVIFWWHASWLPQDDLKGFLDGERLATTCGGCSCIACGPCTSALKQAAQRPFPQLTCPTTSVPSMPCVLDNGAWVEPHLPTYLHSPQSGAPVVTKPPRRTPRVLVYATSSSSASSDIQPRGASPKVPAIKRLLNDDSGDENCSDGASEDTDSISSFGSDGLSSPEPRREVEPTDTDGWFLPMPAAPVGPRVILDSRVSKKRRIHSEEDPETVNEEKFAPFSFPNLLRIKDNSQDWCILCILHKRQHAGHVFAHCAHGQGMGPTLRGVVGGGATFQQAKKQSRLPSNGVICYFCWWPMSAIHGHPPGKPPQVCSVPDQIPQLCWLVYCDPALRKKMCTQFKLEDAQISRADAYARWLGSVARTVIWHGQQSVLTNGQLVFLYFLLVVREVFPRDWQNRLR